MHSWLRAGRDPVRPHTVHHVLTPHPVRECVQGTTRSGLVQYPGGQRVSAVGMQVVNTWPSAQHEAQLSPISAPLNTIGPPLSMSPIPESSAVQAHNQHASHNSRAQSAQPPMSSPMAERRTPPRPGSSPNRPRPAPDLRPASSLPARPGFGSTTERVFPLRDRAGYVGTGMGSNHHGHVGARPMTSVPTGHVNNGMRGAPLLMQNLQKEVEQLRDQLMYQHHLAEASAAKVRAVGRQTCVSAGLRVHVPCVLCVCACVRACVRATVSCEHAFLCIIMCVHAHPSPSPGPFQLDPSCLP